MSSRSALLIAVSTLLLATLVSHTDGVTSLTLSPTQVYTDSERKYQNLVVSINLRLESIEEERSYLNHVKVGQSLAS